MKKRRENCVPLPAAGRIMQLFHLIFTQPGARLLGIPCRAEQRPSCGDASHASFLIPFDLALARRKSAGLSGEQTLGETGISLAFAAFAFFGLSQEQTAFHPIVARPNLVTGSQCSLYQDHLSKNSLAMCDFEPC